MISVWLGLIGDVGATNGSFPNDEAALKLLYLAIKNAGMHGAQGSGCA